MEMGSHLNYEVADHELVAEGSDLRVQVLTLAAGQCVPWHYHSEITDAFVCLEGPMVVETRAPRNNYALTPGQRCAVPPKTAHYVHGESHGRERVESGCRSRDRLLEKGHEIRW
jgi:quercetin dioxygenase-like cupin family protein